MQSAKVLEVTPAGYYSWRNRGKSKTKLKHEALEKEIRRVFDEHNGEYGSPRIAEQLCSEGIITNKRVVADIMRKKGIVANGFKYEVSKPIELYAKDTLLNGEKEEIWVTNIIYISCSNGKLYLNAYIDFSTGEMRSYRLDNTMDKSSVLKPLKNYRGSFPKIIHSDCRVQYRSVEFKEFCEKKEITHTMSAPGKPLDTKTIDNFQKDLKKKVLLLNKGKTRDEMRYLIEKYIKEMKPHI